MATQPSSKVKRIIITVVAIAVGASAYSMGIPEVAAPAPASQLVPDSPAGPPADAPGADVPMSGIEATDVDGNGMPDVPDIPGPPEDLGVADDVPPATNTDLPAPAPMDMPAVELPAAPAGF